jgi:Pyocin activator protein PrtN
MKNGRIRNKSLSEHQPIRMEASQGTAKGVHISDLADYIDKQADAARKECRQLAG